MEFKGFMPEMIRSELEDAVGRDYVSTSFSEKLAYGTDYYWVARMWMDKGKEPPLPDFLLWPCCTAEVSKIMKIANYYKIPVQIWGGGSGSQGAALALAGGILLDMKRMNKLLCVDEISNTITAEAGMNFQTLEWYANERGYSVMHIPSCLTCCTVGGAIAHNGIGILSTKYGKIDDQCISLEAVLPNGDVICSLPIPKHSTGPDIRQMFIGAEGTLGVVTKATFKMVKEPGCRRHYAFLFDNFSKGIETCRKIVQTLKPSLMRLFDEPETTSIIKKILGFPRKGAFMNMTLEGIPEIVDIEEKIVHRICEEAHAEYLGNEYGEKWYENKITFFYPGHTMNNPQMFGTMDTCATFDNVEKIYWAMKHAVEDNFENVRFIAHCSHWYEWGTMIYDRFIMDDPPEDPEESIRLHNRIWNKAVRAAIENGGVINDHHGIGVKLGRLMKEQYGPAMQVLQGLKKSLDPNGILNPYKLGL
ncbi:MAG: FAD-binding oxidoreductase [Synergistaceae bacterium]|nr:FAD-binding oxidoreductase [Synergistaceae bacterium]